MVMVLWTALAACPAHAGRPLETEDPGTAARRSVEVELGTKLSHALSEWGGFDLGLNVAYGLLDSVEIAASLGGTAFDSEGWKPDVLAAALFAKWRFLGEDGETPALALFASGGLPTHAPHLWLHGSGYGLVGGLAFSTPVVPELLARAALVYQVQFSDSDLSVGSVALEWQVADYLSLVGEGAVEVAPYETGEYWTMRGLLGCSLAVHSAVALDLGVGVEGDSELHGVAGVAGVTVGF